MAIFDRKKNTKDGAEPQRMDNASAMSVDPNAEQMLRRQSEPRPTIFEGLKSLVSGRNNKSLAQGDGTAINGSYALNNPISKEAIHKATQILMKYKEGKANLERTIIDNEDWYKLRHWNLMNKDAQANNEVEPTSGWLFNCIANKHADAMDNFPSPNVLPREEGDKGEAEMLSSILPVILDQNDFEETYSDVWNYKLKTGTGVYGVFWNGSKLNGLGDIEIRRIDLLNLFWEPGITDIQDSQNIFHVSLVDNEILLRKYPNLINKLSTATIDIAKYRYDDTVDTTDKSVVVDWYYRKANSQGKTVLHYCKYVNDIVLFATENDPNYRERGFYDHGKYPFVFDPLFRLEGTPAGFGYISVGKSAQEYIDRGNKAIMESMLVNASPRFFVNENGSINEEEFADMNKKLVHVDGALGQDSIIPIRGASLDATYLNVLNGKIDELKETTGNRDISTGGSASGVTAASAIAAMQEAGSKLSRDANKSAYRTFREVCLLCIELIRQFYDLPRCFRIMGNDGTQRFVQYSNAGIQPQMQGNDFGIDLGTRLPLFDIEVTVQKQSPYSKMAQNELALQFYQAGFFNPNNAQQALVCLDMMDFDRKDFVINKIQENNQMLQQMMMLAQMVDAAYGTNEISMGIAAQFGLPVPQGNVPQAKENNRLGGDNVASKEPKITSNARQRVAESTAPTT